MNLEVGRCRAALAAAELVSVTCTGAWPARGSDELTRFDVHYAVAGGEVVPVGIGSMFLDVPRLRARALEGCRELTARAERARSDDDADDWRSWARCVDVDMSFHLEPTGLRGAFTFPLMHTLVVDLEWDDLREDIRADGPLAPMFGGAAYSPPEVTPEEATAWAVSGFGSEATLIERWVRGGVSEPAPRLDRFGGGLARLVVAGADRTPAAPVAGAMGAELRAVRLEATEARARELAWDSDEALRAVEATPRAPLVRWARSREILNLRARGAQGPIRALLPAGSLVVAIGGELGRQGRHVEAWTPLGMGYLASRFLGPVDECVPETAGEPNALVARVRLRRGGGAVDDGWLLGEIGPRSGRVVLREAGDGCALGDELLGVDVEGRVYDVRMTTTAPRGGSTILVVGATVRGEPRVRYVVHRLGTDGSILDQTFEVEEAGEDAEYIVRLGETVDGVYFPLSVQDGDDVRRFVWSDGRLTEQAPE